MEIGEKVKYWMNLSDEDMTVAKVLLDGKKFLYCGFMCHLAVEKILKAVIARGCADDDIPPKWHNLTKLAVHAGIFEMMSEEQQDFLEELNPLHIEARYPEYKSELASAMSKESCMELIAETEELLCWIKKRL
ncbi:MAG: HEPN domain-containing protein [Defluviitaleaceae bacterium]|nr:HEPN domain-containing protein [Defluviitaleaceae bacterium]